MLDGAAELLANESKPAPAQELKALLRNLQHLTVIADEQINKAVQSCKRARGQHREAMASAPTCNFAAAALRDGPGSDVADPDEGEPDFVESPLSQTVTRNGVTVRLEIYGDSAGRWILEVVDSASTSHVWDEHVETDQEALTEGLRALDEEPLEFHGRLEDMGH